MEDSSESLAEATDCAWNIYRIFLVKDAPYEIPLHSRYRKEIMISLANIHLQMFIELEKVVLPELKDHFKSYESTVSFSSLRSLVELKS